MFEITSKRPLCVAWTHIKGGVGPNMVITGDERGDIKFWGSQSLNPLRTIRKMHLGPIISLVVRDDNQVIASADEKGTIVTHLL